MAIIQLKIGNIAVQQINDIKFLPDKTNGMSLIISDFWIKIYYNSMSFDKWTTLDVIIEA